MAAIDNPDAADQDHLRQPASDGGCGGKGRQGPADGQTMTKHGVKEPATAPEPAISEIAAREVAAARPDVVAAEADLHEALSTEVAPSEAPTALEAAEAAATEALPTIEIPASEARPTTPPPGYKRCPQCQAFSGLRRAICDNCGAAFLFKKKAPREPKKGVKQPQEARSELTASTAKVVAQVRDAIRLIKTCGGISEARKLLTDAAEILEMSE